MWRYINRDDDLRNTKVSARHAIPNVLHSDSRKRTQAPMHTRELYQLHAKATRIHWNIGMVVFKYRWQYHSPVCAIRRSRTATAFQLKWKRRRDWVCCNHPNFVFLIFHTLQIYSYSHITSLAFDFVWENREQSRLTWFRKENSSILTFHIRSASHKRCFIFICNSKNKTKIWTKRRTCLFSYDYLSWNIY